MRKQSILSALSLFARSFHSSYPNRPETLEGSEMNRSARLQLQTSCLEGDEATVMVTKISRSSVSLEAHVERYQNLALFLGFVRFATFVS
jgi:hypothetical protein